MPVRVELTDDAVNDLRDRYRDGTLPVCLAKLVRLEDVGEAAGVPLGGELTGFRKIVVGDRTWRVIFRMNPGRTAEPLLRTLDSWPTPSATARVTPTPTSMLTLAPNRPA